MSHQGLKSRFDYQKGFAITGVCAGDHDQTSFTTCFFKYHDFECGKSTPVTCIAFEQSDIHYQLVVNHQFYGITRSCI